MTDRYHDHYPYAGGTDAYRVEAGNSTLLRQAPMTAHTYLTCAIHDIDEVLGKGYAKAHPELIAAYMQTSAIDLAGAVIARALDGLPERVNFSA